MESNTLPGDSAFFPLELNILTEKMIHKAKDELGETKQKREECLEEFKKMIRSSWDTKMFTPEEITRTGLVCLEKEMKNPVTQVCGMVVLIDLKGFSWSHMSQITLKSLKCFIDTVQDGLPVRHKAMHIINNPSIFGTIFNTVKPFLSEKIKKRVYFHGDDLSSLHQFLPPEMLPEEFGGTQGPFGNERFYQSLLDSDEEYKKCQQYGYDAVKM